MTDQTSFQPASCYRHPDRETRLRCNRCEKPICSECAVLTPTGYRCKDCIRSQQKIFETNITRDYFAAFMISTVLGYAGSFVVQFLGFFSLFLAPVAGMIIAETIRWAVRRRRSKKLFQISVIGTVLGSLPMLLLSLLGVLGVVLGGSLGAAGMGLIGLIFQGIYTFLVTGTVYSRLSGIQIRR